MITAERVGYVAIAVAAVGIAIGLFALGRMLFG